jgi:hypothetical protein
MGHQTLVYGVIEVPSARHRGAEEAVAANRRVLDALPHSDEWPFLVRAMFAQTESSEVSIEYSNALIHFAASYKQVEEDWGEWVTKFEQLLFQLSGSAAVVHIEGELVPHYKLEWVARPVASAAARCEWRFVGGPRTTAELYPPLTHGAA